MAIDRDTFENAEEEDLVELSVPDRVLGFLGANEDSAFEAREIASRTGLDDGVVSTALTRLKDRELVDHKGTYWAVTADEERLAHHGAYSRATALFNERLGAEDEDAWRESAPEQRHPSVDADDGDDE